MRPDLLTVLAPMALVLLAGGADAGGPAFCKRYVDQLMPQVIENQTRDCRFTGDRWGTDADAHMRWCRSADEDLATDTTNGV
jgi:hypothetical protein